MVGEEAAHELPQPLPLRGDQLVLPPSHFLLDLLEHGSLLAHTCIEATVRYAAELGYEVTVVKDATADYSRCTPLSTVNLPNYPSAIVTTAELTPSLSSL
jgi:hypothetical protein